MMGMRAQLLRAEQDKELMRVKLEEEVAEREKAQKQVRRGGWLRLGVLGGAVDCFLMGETSDLVSLSDRVD